MKLVVIYTDYERVLARHVISKLEESSIHEVWHVGRLLAGQVAAQAKPDEIRKAEGLIYLLGVKSASDPQCQQDLQLAQQHHLVIFPVLVQPIDLPGSLRHLVPADLSNGDGFHVLMNAIAFAERNIWTKTARATPEAPATPAAPQVVFPEAPARPGGGRVNPAVPTIEWTHIKHPPKVEIVDMRAYGGSAAMRYPNLLSFHISRYPITNQQFHAFLSSDDGYTQLDWWQFNAGALQWHRANPRANLSHDLQQDVPYTQVNWYEAVAYSNWLSHKLGLQVMLPSEALWQAAAMASIRENDGNHSMHYRSAGVTPVHAYAHRYQGAADFIGNTWEWCADDWKSGEPAVNQNTHSRVIRGGSWRTRRQGNLHLQARWRANPALQVDYIGFRVVTLSI